MNVAFIETGLDLLARADMEAIMATMWMRQFLTSLGSLVPSAWRLNPIFRDSWSQCSQGKTDADPVKRAGLLGGPDDLGSADLSVVPEHA